MCGSRWICVAKGNSAVVAAGAVAAGALNFERRALALGRRASSRHAVGRGCSRYADQKPPPHSVPQFYRVAEPQLPSQLFGDSVIADCSSALCVGYTKKKIPHRPTDFLKESFFDNPPHPRPRGPARAHAAGQDPDPRQTHTGHTRRTQVRQSAPQRLLGGGRVRGMQDRPTDFWMARARGTRAPLRAQPLVGRAAGKNCGPSTVVRRGLAPGGGHHRAGAPWDE